MSEAPVGGNVESPVGGKKAPTDKGKRALIAIGLAGVLIAYLTYRRMAAANSTASSSAIPATYGQSSTNAADSAGLTGQNVGIIENQLAGFAQQLAGFQTAQASDEAAATAATAQQNGVIAGFLAQLNNFGTTLTGIAAQGQTTATSAAATTGNDTAVPGLSAALVNQLQANGERITDTVKSTAGGWLFLTNKGGVYTAEGAPSFGSYLGYAATTGNPGAEIAGHGDFSTGHLIPVAGGHYTEVNSKGETYTF